MEIPGVRFEILGPVRAFQGTDELELGSGKQRAVLATLLVEANRPVPPPRIVNAVWGDDPPANGTNVVQKYVGGLRQVLEPNRKPRSAGRLLTLTDGGYRLAVGPRCLDTEVFGEHVRRAQDHRAAGLLEAAAEELTTALALWRAEPLAGLSGPVFDTVRHRLTEARAAALETWGEIELELGHHRRLLPELARLVAEFPLREHLRSLQMLALYRCGRQAEALAAYRQARQLLVDEFGIEPGDRLQQLHQRILQADPNLLGSSDHDPGSTGPAPDPAGRSDGRLMTVVVMALISVLTMGFGGWVAIGYFARTRRDRPLMLIASGYLAVPIGAVLAVGFLPADSRRLMIAGLLALGCGGALHATWLALRSAPELFFPQGSTTDPTPPLVPPVVAFGGARWPWWTKGLLVAVIPLVSLGTATWAVMVFFAVRRRRPELLLMAAGYLVCSVTIIVLSEPEPYGITRVATLKAAFLVPWIGGVLHTARLALEGPARAVSR